MSSETALHVLRGKRVQACIRILVRPKYVWVETACFAITSFRFTEPDVRREVRGVFLCMQTLRFYLTSYYLPAFYHIIIRISAYVSCWRRNVNHPRGAWCVFVHADFMFLRNKLLSSGISQYNYSDIRIRVMLARECQSSGLQSTHMYKSKNYFCDYGCLEVIQ